MRISKYSFLAENRQVFCENACRSTNLRSIADISTISKKKLRISWALAFSYSLSCENSWQFSAKVSGSSSSLRRIALIFSKTKRFSSFFFCFSRTSFIRSKDSRSLGKLSGWLAVINKLLVLLARFLRSNANRG